MRGHYKTANGAQRRVESTTAAVMAAMGMGGGRLRAWVQRGGGDPEAVTLETMKLVIELGELGEPGVDVNAANPDGRTALDVARRLEYETVVAYLVERGARAGTSDNA